MPVPPNRESEHDHGGRRAKGRRRHAEAGHAGCECRFGGGFWRANAADTGLSVLTALARGLRETALRPFCAAPEVRVPGPRRAK